MSLFTKDGLWANHSRCSLKKSSVSDSLVIQANRSQKTNDSLKKFVFFVCLRQVFLFLMPKSESLTLLFAHSLLFRLEWFAPVALYKRATWAINLSNSLRLLITKERLWAIRSRHSLKKSKSAICSQKWANRTFDIRLKNRWANSQPCLYTYF